MKVLKLIIVLTIVGKLSLSQNAIYENELFEINFGKGFTKRSDNNGGIVFNSKLMTIVVVKSLLPSSPLEQLREILSELNKMHKGKSALDSIKVAGTFLPRSSFIYERKQENLISLTSFAIGNNQNWEAKNTYIITFTYYKKNQLLVTLPDKYMNGLKYKRPNRL